MDVAPLAESKGLPVCSRGSQRELTRKPAFLLLGADLVPESFRGKVLQSDHGRTDPGDKAQIFLKWLARTVHPCRVKCALECIPGA